MNRSIVKLDIFPYGYAVPTQTSPTSPGEGEVCVEPSSMYLPHLPKKIILKIGKYLRANYVILNMQLYNQLNPIENIINIILKMESSTLLPYKLELVWRILLFHLQLLNITYQSLTIITPSSAHQNSLLVHASRDSSSFILRFSYFII